MDYTIEYIAATPENIKKCIDLCVSSFSTDELYNWIYQTPIQKNILLSLAFNIYFSQCIKWGGCILGVKTSKDNIIAMALIQPPFTSWDYELGRANLNQHLKSAIEINSFDAHERLLVMDDFFDGCPAAEIDEFYLLFLVVDAAYSNKGLGSKIIQHLISIAELCKKNIALDTSKPSLVKFYNKFGFNVKISRPLGANPNICSYIMKRPYTCIGRQINLISCVSQIQGVEETCLI